MLASSDSLCGIDTGVCNDDVRAALEAAVRSDVSIYVLDPRGLTTGARSRAENANPNSTYGHDGAYRELSSDAAARAAFAESRREQRGPTDGARYLAEESGGFAIVNTNNLEAGIDRIVRENSAYYMIGYYSTSANMDGKFRRHQVRVDKPGVRVLHRAGYPAPRATAASSKPGAIGKVSEQLEELARSPLPVSAMTLRIAAAPFLSAGGRSRVAVVVEMPHEALRPTEEDGRYRLNIGLSVGFYDRDGKSIGSDEPNIELDIPLSAAPKVTRNGMRVVSRIAIPPGAYRLWVGAVQPWSGLRGSVMTDIDVPDFARQSLALSGLALSSTDARRIYTARTDELLDDVLGGPPVAHRTFAAESDLWIYGEIYDNRSQGGDVSAEVTVKSADGKIVLQTPFEPAPVQFGHLARIPLKELGPGSYTATVAAASQLPAPVTATRTMTFRVQ